MHLEASLATLFMLGRLAAGQSTTTSSSSASSTSLPDLVAQIDSCVLGCLPEVSDDINCSSATDFACICSTNPDTFVSRLTPCVLTSGCNIGAATDSASLVPEICAAVSASPAPEALASASNIVVGAAEPTEDPDSPANRVVAVGACGIIAAMTALLLV